MWINRNSIIFILYILLLYLHCYIILLCTSAAKIENESQLNLNSKRAVGNYKL